MEGNLFMKQVLVRKSKLVLDILDKRCGWNPPPPKTAAWGRILGTLLGSTTTNGIRYLAFIHGKGGQEKTLVFRGDIFLNAFKDTSPGLPPPRRGCRITGDPDQKKNIDAQ